MLLIIVGNQTAVYFIWGDIIHQSSIIPCRNAFYRFWGEYALQLLPKFRAGKQNMHHALLHVVKDSILLAKFSVTVGIAENMVSGGYTNFSAFHDKVRIRTGILHLSWERNEQGPSHRWSNWLVLSIDITTTTFLLLLQYHPQFVWGWRTCRFPIPNTCEQRHRPHEHCHFFKK